ncbi:hypothetical protein CU633_01825 [Bacillus sp. V3-13]|uniref:hypothetical protein n=1 Tax=Bacillus sp. V3-13 TaxID=2053728 RepID=UPI000C77CACB|nr:hypothetical protein [Bacillus sp. V3-13]PLR79130.1 hypothetical protein CU633_01825 [Bacillus sp. V3-13]
MKKTLLTISSLIIAGSLIAGCNTTKVEDESTKTTSSNPQTTDGEKSEDRKTIDEKAWKDVTIVQDGVKYDFPTNAKDWISSVNITFQEEPAKDSELIQAGLDKYYNYYVQALAIQSVLEIIQVEGVALEKDFDNLYLLTKIIEEEQIKRTEHIDPDQYDKRDPNQRLAAIKEWKAPSEKMVKAIEYTKQLLNDINVAINKDGKGDLFGVAYQVDGQNTSELEVFVKSEE